MSKEVRKRKRKLSIQKIFNFASASFILACCIFYGTRFIKLYNENNKEQKVDTLTNDIMKNNHSNKNFKKINNIYYFNGKNQNNYLRYSNLIWRIIKINEDKTITAISENSLTALAPGSNNSFEDSHINNWLNDEGKEYTGILQNNLNDTNKYLTYTPTCNNTINNNQKINCDSTIKDTYITTPSIDDYINTGEKESFMNNNEYFYLINYNTDDKIWYIDDQGKTNTSDKSDVLGIKAVITIKKSISRIDGDGSKDNPYTIETENPLFGSYVKLGEDTWRVHNINENKVSLSLDSYLEINNEEISYKYSNNNYYHNDTIYGSLAYYLNKNYLNNLDYKDIIKEEKFPNGIYSNTDDFDYQKVLKTTISTKVAPLSIGNIILNPKLTNYYLSTGISENSNLIYTLTSDFNIYTKNGSSEKKIIPTIQIDKNILTKGDGTINNPYEVK